MSHATHFSSHGDLAADRSNQIYIDFDFHDGAATSPYNIGHCPRWSSTIGSCQLLDIENTETSADREAPEWAGSVGYSRQPWPVG